MRKPQGFLMFSGSIDKQNRAVMGYCSLCLTEVNALALSDKKQRVRIASTSFIAK